MSGAPTPASPPASSAASGASTPSVPDQSRPRLGLTQRPEDRGLGEAVRSSIVPGPVDLLATFELAVLNWSELGSEDWKVQSIQWKWGDGTQESSAPGGDPSEGSNDRPSGRPAAPPAPDPNAPAPLPGSKTSGSAPQPDLFVGALHVSHQFPSSASYTVQVTVSWQGGRGSSSASTSVDVPSGFFPTFTLGGLLFAVFLMLSYVAYARNIGPYVTLTVVSGIDAFAVTYLMAQIIERVLEPFSHLSWLGTGDRKAITLGGLAAGLGVFACTMTTGIFAIAGIHFAWNGRFVDDVLSGLLVGGGTKPLHDLIGYIESAKSGASGS